MARASLDALAKAVERNFFLRSMAQPVTSKGRFMDNGACIQLLTQSKQFDGWQSINPVLPKREVKSIQKMEHDRHPHNYGKSVTIFSL